MLLWSFLGTFLVNGLSAHVLFYSGATGSFVSLALSKKFRDALGTLDSPLKVEIMDDRTVSVTRVFWGNVLNLFDKRFHIDIISIPLRWLKVIIKMDWLEPNGAMTNCERQLVRVRTLSGGELLIHGEILAWANPLFGCEGYETPSAGMFWVFCLCLGYEGEATSKMSKVPIVWYFPSVFPEEFPRVPPKRQVEFFFIDLMSGAAPIAKATYRLASSDM